MFEYFIVKYTLVTLKKYNAIKIQTNRVSYNMDILRRRNLLNNYFQTRVKITAYYSLIKKLTYLTYVEFKLY